MKSRQDTEYQLPKQIDALLGVVTRMLVGKGDKDLVEIIVNARVEVAIATDYESWDGGDTGHTLRLHVGESLLRPHWAERAAFAERIRDALRDIAAISGEHIATVLILVDLESVPVDWREQSGALLRPPTLANASTPDLARLWGSGNPRIFLSHKADHKLETKLLKEELAFYGAASFVAHDDIEPSQAWQREIERALASMDVLVALGTEGFAASAWTNQEIGIAIGRGTPVVAVKIDEDPPGFVGAKQAVAGHGRGARDLAKSIAASMKAYKQLDLELCEALVRRWEATQDFGTATRLMGALESYEHMPKPLLARLESSFATNDQLNGCGGMPQRFSEFLKRTKMV